MSFLDLELKTEYRSSRDNIIKDFYMPILKQARLYKRAVGFFSSSALVELKYGIRELINNGGSIQMIVSPQLSDEELEAINYALLLRKQELKENRLNDFHKERLNLLSELIYSCRLDLKIAFFEENNPLGRFNEKLGIFYDGDGNIIAFAGSMNESKNAFTNNYETIDVFTSWSSDADRVKAKEEAFDLLWNNNERGVQVFDFDFTKVRRYSYSEVTPNKFPSTFIEEPLTNQTAVSSVNELFADTLEKFATGKVNMPGVPTGFKYLDAYIGGLKKSDMLILAARPSMGKSALAMNIAAEVAKKHSVLFLSLEMNKTQLIERIVASAARVHATKIQHRNLDDAELERVLDEADRVNDMKLFIDDTAGIGLPEIKMKACKMQREHGLDLIVIDYLQLMQASKAYRGDRVQEVSELSRGIKSLARELNIPILALSQLSRAVESRADKRPMLSDLRESGSIEQDADIVMFLYRDDYYDHESDVKGLAELIVAKNRNGAIGRVPFRFEKEFVRFEEVTRLNY